MARPGVLYGQVSAAAEGLVGSGRKPTIKNIREIIGSGSSTTISRHLKQWKGEKSGVIQDDVNSQSARVSEQRITDLPERYTDIPDSALFIYPEYKAKPSVDEVRSSEPENEPARYTVESLEVFSEEQLRVKILQLEALLVKEKARRESTENMTRDLCYYADVLKGEIARRIESVEQSFEGITGELCAEVRQLRMNAASDLKFYRKALTKSNAKISKLLTTNNNAQPKDAKKK